MKKITVVIIILISFLFLISFASNKKELLSEEDIEELSQQGIKVMEEEYCYNVVEDFLIDCVEELVKVRPELSNKHIECMKLLYTEKCSCVVYSNKEVNPAFDNENISKVEVITGINPESYFSFKVKENALKIKEKKCFKI